jgi:hypothetical protein
MGDAFFPLAFGTALAAVVALISSRRVRSSSVAWLLSVGFVAVAVAFIWWLVRWFNDGCPDSPCEGHETAAAVIASGWVALVLAAAVALIAIRYANRSK